MSSINSELTQFVYVYWHGGAQSDELRWSLRSIESNFVGQSEVVVVGDRPPYYGGPLIHKPRVANQPKRGFRDVLNKIHAACTSPLVRDQFVWMMDDIYFIKPVTFDDLSKHYRGGKIPARYKEGSEGWTGFKADTFRVVASQGLPLVDYCTHLPHVLEKDKWLFIWKKYNLNRRVLQWELLYGAEFFRTHYPVRLIRTRVSKQGAVFDSIGRIGNNSNNGWSDELRKNLYSRFPNKSLYEVDDYDEPLKLADRIREALEDPNKNKFINKWALLHNPVAEIDRYCLQFDPYVKTEEYLEALSVVKKSKELVK